MKKQFIALALISGLTLAGTASANWGRAGMGGGCSSCPQSMGQFNPQVDQATQDKIEQFFADNQALRKEMMMKRAEKRAMMRSDNPDPKAVAKVTGELFDLRMTMRANAVKAGVDKYLGPGRMGSGMACNGGSGSHHGKGHGMGQRWKQ